MSLWSTGVDGISEHANRQCQSSVKLSFNRMECEMTSQLNRINDAGTLIIQGFWQINNNLIHKQLLNLIRNLLKAKSIMLNMLNEDVCRFLFVMCTLLLLIDSKKSTNIFNPIQFFCYKMQIHGKVKAKDQKRAFKHFWHVWVHSLTLKQEVRFFNML